MIESQQERVDTEGCSLGLVSSMATGTMVLANESGRIGTMYIESSPDGSVPTFNWEEVGTEGIQKMQEGCKKREKIDGFLAKLGNILPYKCIAGLSRLYWAQTESGSIPTF